MAIVSRRAADVDEGVLVEAWNAAYHGYFVPMRRAAEDLRVHYRVGSIDLDRSIVRAEGDRPVALSLLGVRAGVASGVGSGGACGLRGWVGGFGVAPSHRGRGLAGELLEEQLAVARSSGIARVVLEVLEQNWARRVYERSGFVITRRLLVLTGSLAPPADRRWSTGVATWWATSEDRARLAPALTGIAGGHGAWAMPWGREPLSVLAAANEATLVVGAGSREQPDALLVVREQPGGWSILAGEARTAEGARAVTAALAERSPGAGVRDVNEPEGSALVEAFAAVGVVAAMAQFEMALDLD
jgi:GNAT superfamily N-acetyltransferase